MTVALSIVLATFRYGGLAPTTLWGHTIVYMETFVSIIVLALVTGIPYIKFSKPSTKLVFGRPVINIGPRCAAVVIARRSVEI